MPMQCWRNQHYFSYHSPRLPPTKATPAHKPFYPMKTSLTTTTCTCRIKADYLHHRHGPFSLFSPSFHHTSSLFTSRVVPRNTLAKCHLSGNKTVKMTRREFHCKDSASKQGHTLPTPGVTVRGPDTLSPKGSSKAQHGAWHQQRPVGPLPQGDF